MADNQEKPKMNKLDVVLMVMFIVTMIFTLAMVILFCLFQSIPDTLVTAFFGIVSIELACCGWVKNAKEKSRRIRQTQKKEDKTCQ